MRRYNFKTPPRKHQIKALKFMLRRRPRGGALFMPMRSGKTKIVIDFVCCLLMILRMDRIKVLVVCPKGVIPVWYPEIRKHSPVAGWVNGRGYGNRAERKIRWRIINYEKVYSRERWENLDEDGKVEDYGYDIVFNDKLARWKADVIVVDESHKIGDPTTKQALHLWKQQREVNPIAKVIMTGTPYHRGQRLMIFGQMKFLDDSVFGSAFTAFKKIYARWGGYGGYILMGYVKQKQMRRKIKPHTFQMRRIPKVAPMHVNVEFELEESREIYKAIANDFVAEIDGQMIVADHPFSRAMKLAQLESGWIADEEGQWHRVGREKYRALQNRLELFRDQDILKLVFFAVFRPELLDLVKAVRAAGYAPLLMQGATDLDLREQRLAYFAEAEAPTAFIAQVTTGSMGIDMSAASTACYYSHHLGLVDYDQSQARIQLYRDVRQLTYEHFYGRGCIGGVDLSRLHAGIDLANYFAHHPDLLSYEEEE